ncbi:MAG: lactonase family protein [Dermatophilaceae bacterium]
MYRKLARCLVPAAALAICVGAVSAATANAQPISGDRPGGRVYETTNAGSGNAIQVFDRTSDGELTAAETVPTGGLGTGASLHSQGGLIRQDDLLLAVNAGSGTLSTLQITSHGLQLQDTISTNGVTPVSVTAHDGIGYVLNQGSDTITGFRYTVSGRLTALAHSTRSLTPNPTGGSTDAAQISFTPDGSALLVTEKASNTLDTFAVRDGHAQRAVAHPSAGTTPYGFDFDKRAHAVISEATTGSASSYDIGRRDVDVISAAVSDTQAAACWLVIANRGGNDYAYVVNAASGTVSSYLIHRDGSLTLLQAVAATTGPGGTDATLSADQRSLHVRMGGGVVSSWALARDGSLTPVGTTTGAPAFGTAGLAAS